MADEIENKEPAGEANAPEPTAIELRAMESGWVPEDQWQGDPELWRPAKEYVDRGELFKKIDDQNRTIKDFKRALDDLKGHHAKVRETEYARALVALKEQKKTALEDGDAAGVIKIDDQIDLVKEEQKRLAMPQQTQQTSEAAPEFTNWVARNKWYDTSEPMRAYADSLGRKLAAAGTSTEEVLREVERQVKQEFPHKFVNPNRGKPGAVEGSSPKGGKAGDNFALSDDERRVMQRFVRSGVMTEAQYIKDLKSVRGE
ncbi:MAG: hypothetical protein KGI54_11475 [Pseudomonadota bacterium]|nr:hypothetical protein [Pseudomonadota bacterium]